MCQISICTHATNRILTASAKAKLSYIRPGSYCLSILWYNGVVSRKSYRRWCSWVVLLRKDARRSPSISIESCSSERAGKEETNRNRVTPLTCFAGLALLNGDKYQIEASMEMLLNAFLLATMG